MESYEFKPPEKLLSDLTDSSETDSESSNDERSFDDSDADLNYPESETVDENKNLNRSMSHVDAIFNETNDLNRSMSHVDAIFNDHSNTWFRIIYHYLPNIIEKRPLNDD